MSVTSVEKDLDNLTLTLIADFDASVEQVWDLWADPRKLERWWGPPTYPATFERFDLTPGAEITYFMTGPEGDKHHDSWRVIAVDPPNSLEFADGLFDQPDQVDGPLTGRVQISEHDGGTRMELRMSFASKDEMEKADAMGMPQGLSEAAGQMDALLAG